MSIDSECDKCGEDGDGKILRAYHRNTSACEGVEYKDKGNAGEHLHYHCKSCGYTWCGPTIEQQMAKRN